MTLSPPLELFLPPFSPRTQLLGVSVPCCHLDNCVGTILCNMYFFTSVRVYLCTLKYMTLQSCNVVHGTLTAVQAEVATVCFYVKYHPARLPGTHGGPDQSAGKLLTPPLEKTNFLTMKHLSPLGPHLSPHSSPPHFASFFFLSTPSYLVLLAVLSSGCFLFSHISPFS